MSVLLLAALTGCAPCADGFGRAADGNCYPLVGGDTADTGDTGTGDTSDTGDTGGDTADPPALVVTLTWEHGDDDLNLHLVAPAGTLGADTDCHFVNCLAPAQLDWGVTGDTADNPVLDVNDITGTGPETITLVRPADGQYTVIVHDYPGSVFNSTNGIEVTIETPAGSWNYVRQINGEDSDNYVLQVQYPGGTVTGM